MATGLRTRKRHGERGQVLPLLAGGLLVLLVLVGLVIDTGVAFKERRTAQNISDLAAMAGTRLIAEEYLNPSVHRDGRGRLRRRQQEHDRQRLHGAMRMDGRLRPADPRIGGIPGTFIEMEPLVNSGDVPGRRAGRDRDHRAGSPGRTSSG